MYSYMYSHIARFREASWTKFAFEWLFFGVCSHMDFVRSAPHKFIPTFTAFIWSFSSVRACMLNLMCLCCKVFFAVFAFVGLISRVNPGMSIQITFLAKLFTAY